MASVRWTVSARRQLREILEYLALWSAAAVLKLEADLQTAIGQLTDYPQSGRSVPEFGDTELREVVVGDYRLFYVFSGDEIRILALVHGRRNLGRILGEQM